MYKYFLLYFALLSNIACNNNSHSQNASIQTNNENSILTKNNTNIQKTELPSQKNTPQATYNWDKHNDPRIFFADFQNAIKNRDQEAIYNMMNIPFKCNDYLCVERDAMTQSEFDNKYPINKGYRSYSINNKKEFYEKYDYLFSQEAIDIILNIKNIKTSAEIIQEIKDSNDQELLDESWDWDDDEETIEFYIKHGHLIIKYNNKGMYKLMEIPYED